MKNAYDAAIIGAGPNGLTAANVLAAAGLLVIVLEVHDRVGGSCRTEALTLPGFAHDVCSATHPMAVVSPAFRGFQLDRFGWQWASGPALLAHLFDHGPGRVARAQHDQYGGIARRGWASVDEHVRPVRRASRASPVGTHTGWAYCHVPIGSAVDMTDRIERQIQRFAPGFRDVVLARHVMTPAAVEAYNPNRIGGDTTVDPTNSRNS